MGKVSYDIFFRFAKTSSIFGVCLKFVLGLNLSGQVLFIITFLFLFIFLFEKRQAEKQLAVKSLDVTVGCGYVKVVYQERASGLFRDSGETTMRLQ